MKIRDRKIKQDVNVSDKECLKKQCSTCKLFKSVNAPRRKQRGIYGFAPMVCIPKPIMLVFSIFYFIGKDFTNRPIRFNLISLISKSRTGNASGTFSLQAIYLS